MEEKVSAKPGKSARKGLVRSSTPVRLSEIEVKEEMRVKMPSSELNRVLGGGLVTGSLTLIGGEPGIGKSTLLLQNILSIRNRRILYVSGEESASQLKRTDLEKYQKTHLYCVKQILTTFSLRSRMYRHH